MSKRSSVGDRFRRRRESRQGHQSADPRNLDTAGRTGDTVLTAFTGGYPAFGIFSPTPMLASRQF